MKLFYIKNEKKGINASGFYKQESGEFVVNEGSVVEFFSMGTCKNVPLRDHYIKDFCRPEGKDFAIIENPIVFPSPSAAAVFVKNKSSNGWTEWKDEDKKPLDSFYERKK